MKSRSFGTAGIMVCLLFMAAPGGGTEKTGAPVLQAVVEPKKATIGTEIVSTLTVEENDTALSYILPGEKPYYPESKGEKGKTPGTTRPADAVPLYIIHRAAKTEKKESRGRTVTVTVVLSYYRPGVHRLPEIEIYDAEKIRIGYRVPEISIDAVNKTGGFRDIEGPLELRGNYSRLMIIVAAVLMAAVAGYLGHRWYRNRNKSVTVEVGPSPIDVFLRSTDELRRLAVAGDAARYGEAVSRCFRNFLSDRYGVDAMEMTAAELQRFLGRHVPAGGYLKAVQPVEKILELWELSKFAGFAPPAQVLGANLDATVELSRRLDREDVLVRS